MLVDISRKNDVCFGPTEQEKRNGQQLASYFKKYNSFEKLLHDYEELIKAVHTLLQNGTSTQKANAKKFLQFIKGNLGRWAEDIDDASGWFEMDLRQMCVHGIDVAP